MQDNDREILNEIRSDTLSQLRSVLSSTRTVALVDVPVHRNVGDFLIYEGARRYLSTLGKKIEYVSDLRRFDSHLLRRRMPEGTVLINGGGNFGDLWPDHQCLKEQIANELPDYPIVQLPQTIHFRDRSRMQQANDIMGAHPNFTLFARDLPSFERATSGLPSVKTLYAPDVAFGWEPENRTSGFDAEGILVLARTDQESTSELLTWVSPWLQQEDRITDWQMSLREQALYSLARVPGKISNGGNEFRKRGILYPSLERSLNLISWLNISSAVRLFSRANVVITDRLHAHILATMMGIPSIAVDNAYGKVKALHQDYIGRFSTNYFAEDAQDLASYIHRIKWSSLPRQSESAKPFVNVHQ